MGDVVISGWGDCGCRGRGRANDPRLVLKGQSVVAVDAGFFHTLCSNSG